MIFFTTIIFTTVVGVCNDPDNQMKAKICNLHKKNFMAKIAKSTQKKTKKYTGIQILERVLADRKMIKEHLAKGVRLNN